MVCGCFCFYNTLKIHAFYPAFPLRNPQLRYFVGYSFGTSRKKHQPFSMTQPSEKAPRIPAQPEGCAGPFLVKGWPAFFRRLSYGCFSVVRWKYILFIWFFRWWTPWLGRFMSYSFGTSNNQQNALAVDSANGKTGEKGCIFHRAVGMKQPHAMAEPFRKASLPASYGLKAHQHERAYFFACSLIRSMSSK